MKSIGIKLADGSFYPIMNEGSAEKKTLDVTTVKDNQTTVQIDLYRSDTDSMADAEYVDTLEITNLNPHPNGEPSLKLDISLDEENKLHAQVRDRETGKVSQTQVALVSRTLAERNEPANFSIDTTAENPPEALLAGIDAVSTVLDNTDQDEALPEATVDDRFFDANPIFSEDNLLSDTPLSDADLLSGATDPAEKNERAFDLPDFDDIQTDTSSTNLDEAFTLPDFGNDNEPLAEESVAPETTQDESFASASEDDSTLGVTSALDDFDLPDFSLPETGSELTDFGSSDEPPAKEDAPAEEAAQDEPFASASEDDSSLGVTSALSDFDLPDFSLPETGNELTDFGSSDEPPAKEDAPAEEAAQDEPFAGASEDDSSLGVTSALDDFDLPDFSLPETGSELTDFGSSAEPPAESESTEDESSLVAGLPDFDDDFSLPETNEQESYNFPSSDFEDELPHTDSSQETASRSYTPKDEDDSYRQEKKSKPYAIICIICAAICMVAVLLLLFVFPKINLRQKTPTNAQPSIAQANTLEEDSAGTETVTQEKKTKQKTRKTKTSKKNEPRNETIMSGAENVLSAESVSPPKDTGAQKSAQGTQEETAANKTQSSPLLPAGSLGTGEARDTVLQATIPLDSQTPAQAQHQPEEYTPAPIVAKEDAIVFSARPQTVVPEPPAAPSKKQNDITYHVKWGDTLWDISNAYYKNPWRYKRIADYNGIKDPDYIVAGSTILIPAE